MKQKQGKGEQKKAKTDILKKTGRKFKKKKKEKKLSHNLSKEAYGE